MSLEGVLKAEDADLVATCSFLMGFSFNVLILIIACKNDMHCVGILNFWTIGNWIILYFINSCSQLNVHKDGSEVRKNIHSADNDILMTLDEETI